jgi:hypothetical protein
MNQTIVNRALAMLIDSRLPKTYWTHAFHTAIYLIARSPASGIDGRTPFKVLTGQRVNSSGLWPFGCRAYALVPKDQRSKLDPHACRCVLLGYKYASKAYTLLDVATWKMFKSRHVVFDEAPGTVPELQHDNAEPIEWERALPDTERSPQTTADPKTVLLTGDSESVFSEGDPVPICENECQSPKVGTEDHTVAVKLKNKLAMSNVRDHSPPPAEEAPIAQRRGRRNIKPPPRVPQLVIAQKTVPPKPPVNQLQKPSVAIVDTSAPPTRTDLPESPLTELSSDVEDNTTSNSIYCQFTAFAESAPKAADTPRNLNDAFSGPDATQWKAALDEELASLAEKKVFRVVPRPKNAKVIGVRPVMRIKVNADGGIERYKLRLVAQGFNQKKGVDYKESYSPTLGMDVVRVIADIAAEEDLELHQLDISTAYLNGELKEEVYVMPPDGVDCPPGHVWALDRTLYGLPQSGYVWNVTLHNALVKIGFM